MSVLSRLDLARRTRLQTRFIDFFGTATGYSVGEGEPKPLSSGALTPLTVEPRKHVGVIVVSDETMRHGAPGTEGALTREVAAAAGAAEDVSLLDPVRAGSLLNGAPSVASTGSALAQIDADLKALVDALTTRRSTLLSAVFAMSPKTATHLALLRGSGGAPAFPGITAAGGTLLGLPALVSGAVSGYLALLDQSGIVIGDDGDVRINKAAHASVQMDSAPTNPPTAGTVMVNLWQHNLVGVMAEISRGWLAREGAAAYISGVTY